jgi:hypothetical protein
VGACGPPARQRGVVVSGAAILLAIVVLLTG